MALLRTGEMQHSESISSPETDLEMFSSNSESHTFHSSILDDFQLDLELECEEDGTSFSMGDKNYCSSYSLGSNSSPATVCVPLADAHQDFTKGENQIQRHTPITELIAMTMMDNKRKEEDIISPGGGICLRKMVEENHKYSQSDPCKSSSLLSGQNELSSLILDGNIPQNCRPIICHVCKILFSSLESLQSHLLDQHTVVKTEHDIDNDNSSIGQSSRCDASSTNSQRIKNITKSRKTHSLERKKKCKNLGPFHCQICSYVGKKQVLLQEHIKHQHNPKRETFKCKLCSFSCVQERSLKVHMLTHEGVEGKFACDQCGKLFFSMGILKRHARTHNTCRPYLCPFDQCNKAFTIKSRITDHLRTVHKSPHSLKKIKTAERDDFKDKDIIHQLNEVEGIIREVDSPYGADESPGTSVNSKVQAASSPQARQQDTIEIDNDLTIVYDIVLPESSLHESKCSGEDIMWKQPTLENTYHMEPSASMSCDKKFLCSWTGCEKRFRDNYNLRKHIATHTGEMERACPLCRYRCIQKSALDKHMKTHKRLIFGKML